MLSPGNGKTGRERFSSLAPPLSLLVGLFLVLTVHLAWACWNDAPPVWDMAYHQLQGYRYLEAWRQGVFFEEFANISPHYPPLYYLIEAAFLGITRAERYLAFLSNLPAILLLCGSGYLLARHCVAKPLASWAGLLVLLLPMVAWVSRESLLDGLLAGWVGLGAFLVVRSRFFQEPGWSLLFGLVTAAGTLTKWTFPIYLAVPVLYAVWKTPRRDLAIRNILLAAALCLPLVLTYYGPNLGRMISSYPTTEQTGLIPWKSYPRHGEPGLNNPLGWIYYPRVLASYFLFLPLLVVFLAGCWRERGSESPPGCPLGFFWSWLAGGIVLLTFVSPKDPRFALPIALPLALLLLLPWRDSPLFFRGVILFAFLQFLTISFSMPLLPLKIAFFERQDDRDFQTLQQEWVLYESEYFDVAGPPRSEDWGYQEILGELPDESTVGFLPDLARFHSEGLLLAAARAGKDLRVLRLGYDGNWQERLRRVDFVVTKTGYQGISFITGFNRAVTGFLHRPEWIPSSSWGLPDGTEGRVWRRTESTSDDTSTR